MSQHQRDWERGKNKAKKGIEEEWEIMEGASGESSIAAEPGSDASNALSVASE